MSVTQHQESIISLEGRPAFFTLLREMTHHCRKFLFTNPEAHTPFLKSRLHYIMFLLFFVVYSVSPLKICADRTVKGLMQDSEAASIRIVIVERILSLMSDRLLSESWFSSDEADVEVMVKKKRALLRSFTLFFLLLMAIATHIAARLYLGTDLIIDPSRFRFSRSSEHINIIEVYRSPHSGLAPPYLHS
ncbi:MAG: hypothetical protein HZB62_09080 [Nitrospirae bacterium]|nr:hypothetical protein [Nitrospirota bacterium]